jgi:hypothetical protein
VKSARLTDIESRAGVAPPTTTVPTAPTGADGEGTGLDAIGDGEVGGLLGAGLGAGGVDTAGVVIGAVEGAA